MRQFPSVVLNQTVSGSTTYNSAAIPAEYMFQLSAQIVAAGSGAGTLQLQVSNDYGTTGSFTPTNWSNITAATVTVTGNGAFIIPQTYTCYKWVRLSYANTGTGTIVVTLQAYGL